VESILFYLFAALSLFSAFMVITRRNPVSSALYLILTFFSLAGIYVLMGAFFLAAVQIMVYAGAIMVLFLFVIMLLNLDPSELPPPVRGKVKWVFAAFTLLLGILLIALDAGRQLTAEATGITGEVGEIADGIFGEFLLPFEITGLLLLVAIIGAVVLVRGDRNLES
jgi:NADH-quinone oxidoreductase subunit J